MCWLVVGALCRGAEDLLLRVGQLPREQGRILGERGLTENRLPGCPGCSFLRLSIVGIFSWIIASWPRRPWAKVGGEWCGQAAVILQTWPGEAAPRQNTREREFQISLDLLGWGWRRAEERTRRQRCSHFFKKRFIYGCAEFWLLWVGFL